MEKTTADFLADAVANSSRNGHALAAPFARQDAESMKTKTSTDALLQSIINGDL